ncbi:MAG: envelope stress response membrane protein PspB [Rhodospirillaceae bacterium]
MSDFAIVLMVLFLTFVAPLWIIFHYVTRWRTAKSLTAEDERMLGNLWESAERMEGRIQALERILDAEAPGWRSKV